MALKFKCKNCDVDIITKFLKVGEAAKCKSCGAENVVPETAAETDQEPGYLKQSPIVSEEAKERLQAKIEQARTGEVQLRSQKGYEMQRSKIWIRHILSGLGMAGGSTAVMVLFIRGTISGPDYHNALGYFVILAPLNYTFFSALGVYLAGKKGNGTGSFWFALLGSALGMVADVVLVAALSYTHSLADYLFSQHPKKTLAIMMVILLAVPPAMATICFKRIFLGKSGKMGGNTGFSRKEALGKHIGRRDIHQL